MQQGNECFDIPAAPVIPVDLIGAGDSFNAGFLSGYVRGLPPQQCAEMGVIAGAISTLKPGGIEAFRDRHGLRAAIMELAPALKDAFSLAGTSGARG